MNKKIILSIIISMFMLILIPNVMASIITDAHGVTLATTDSSTNRDGAGYIANKDIQLIGLTKHNSVTATHVEIYNATNVANASNGINIFNVSFDGNYANFTNLSITFDEGDSFYFLVSKLTSSFTRIRNTASVGSTKNYNGTNVVMVRGQCASNANPHCSASTGGKGGTNFTNYPFFDDWIYSVVSIDTLEIAGPIPILTSNLSTYTSVNSNFSVQLNITNNNATYQCTVISNDTDVSCTTENITLATNTTNIDCNIINENDKTVSFTPSCTGDYNFNGSSSNIILDFSAPVVTSNINGTTTNNQVNFWVNFIDSSLFNFTINDNCNYSFTNTSSSTINHTFNYNTRDAGCLIGQYHTNITSCDVFGYCITPLTEYWNIYGLMNITIRQALNTSLLVSNFSVYEDGVLIGNTTTGTFLYNYTSQQTNINISIIPEDYEFTSRVINITESYTSVIFDLYPFNTLNITFKDEKTGDIITTKNITFELISDSFASNYSTATGTLWISDLTSGFYAARYNTVETGYNERFYYFNLVNGTFNNIVLYLLDDGNSTEITATVIDQNGNELEDAYIEVLRYNILTNSYELVEVAKTNFNGETKIYLEKNTEFYYFIVEYPFQTQVLTTSPTYIYSDTLTLQVILGSVVGETFDNLGDLIYNLTFNYATNNFRFSFNDPNNLITSACLRVYKIYTLTETLYNETCLDSASGTILINVDNSTGNSYKAQCFVSMSPESYLDTIFVSFAEYVDFGSLGVFIIIIMVVLFAMIGIWSPIAAVILTPIPITFGTYFNMIEITMTSCVALHIISFIIAFILMTKKR